MSSESHPTDGAGFSREGKYLTLSLDGTEFGISVSRVLRILEMMEVTPIPRTPEFVRGVLNLRGQIIPLVDLRTVMSLPSSDDDLETRIVVVDMDGTDTGMVVDSVHEVLYIEEESIEERPEFGFQIDTDFVFGVSKKDGNVTILLDIDAVMAESQVNTLAQLAKAA
jgi:purine-binding chemotaxis protein CheW